MSDLPDLPITAITVNFKTPGLTHVCVTSFRNVYPSIPYILIDNGGCPRSIDTCTKLTNEFNLTFIRNPRNRYHGPALNQGIARVTTPYVFTLDSDTETKKLGFLELMLAEFTADPDLFAIGWLRYVGNQGVPTPRQELKRGHPYVHPYASLLDVAKFRTLPLYDHTGAPATRTMIKAIQKGYHLKSFPIEKYIDHVVAGTRGIFEGRFNPPTGAKPTQYKKRRI